MENPTPVQTPPSASSRRGWPISAIIVLIAIIGVLWYQSDHRTDNVITGSPGTPITQEITQQPVSKNPAASSTLATTNKKNLMHTITLETNKGTIVFETYDADAPKAVTNFITLANKGFYNGVIFHRVIDGFMIQGGDPTGTGTGGPGYTFADELNPDTESYKKSYTRGTVAMANAGPNTNGSQFFIMHKDYALPNNYTIFGRVIEGIEVVDVIATTPRNQNDKPLTDVVIQKAVVTEKK